MTLKKLYVLAALAGLLVSDSVAAQQSSISDRMRHQTVRPVQKRQPASRLATFSGTSAKSDGTATNATTADSVADKSAEAAQSDAGNASQVQQIPMREKIRPAVMTRVLEQSPDNSATSRRPIELTGFAPDSEDNGDFLKSLDANPAPVPTLRKAPVVVQKKTRQQASAADKPVAAPQPNRSVPPLPATATATRGASEAMGPQRPAANLEWVYPTETTPGTECPVKLVISNPGTATLFGAVADVLIPAGVEILGTNPPAVDASATEMRWELGNLRAGESREIAMQIRARSAGEQQLEASVSLSAAATCRLNITEPKLAIKVTAPEDSELGQQTSVTVDVSNPGTGRAEDVVLVASLPEGLEHKSGAVVTIDIGTLNPGEARRARLSLTAIAGGGQQIELKAAGTGDLLAETTATVEVAEPELQLAVQVPDQEISGQSGSYVVQLENTGLVPAANVRARYVLPAGFEFLSADRGGRFVPADRAVEWFVGTVNAGETTGFTAILKAGRSGRSEHRISAQTDFGEIAATEEVTQVEGSADLKLELATLNATPGTTLRNGQQTTLRVLIRNAGSEAARSVGMSCELPAGLTLIDVEGPADYIAENGVLVFRSLPEIAAGDSAEFLLQVRCSRGGVQSSRIRIASASTAQPLIGELQTEVQN